MWEKTLCAQILVVSGLIGVFYLQYTLIHFFLIIPKIRIAPPLFLLFFYSIYEEIYYMNFGGEDDIAKQVGKC